MSSELLNAKNYNPWKIPPNWDLAKIHALSRRVGNEEEGKDSLTCPCCGYEIERLKIGLCDNTEKLSFLGAGYPMFYNFI